MRPHPPVHARPRRRTALLGLAAVASTLLAVTAPVGPAQAACVAGSVTLKADLWAITIDANRLVHFDRKVGQVTKKATLKADCTGTTSYQITGTKGLVQYPDGTRFQPVGAANFSGAGLVTVTKGSIDTTIVGTSAQTGINSDSFGLSDPATAVRRFQVLQSWR